MMIFSLIKRLFQWLELIKISHTVFALPFALISALVAAKGFPDVALLGWMLLCMIGARTAAMAFNRFADWEFDKLNPRTAGRSLLASKKETMFLCGVGITIFYVGVSQLNTLCRWLSPVALMLVLGYSLTKRFTSYAHVFLGFALAAAPMGAWIAVTGSISCAAPWILSGAVLFWVWGFDLIYATQDVTADQKAGLYSYPARYGVASAIRVAGVLHVIAWGLLLLFGVIASLGKSYYFALGGTALALAYEHWLSRSGDIKKINRAFFEVNAVVGMMMLLGVGFGVRP